MARQSSLREIDMSEIDQVAGGASVDYECNGTFESVSVTVAGRTVSVMYDKSSGTTDVFTSKN